MLEQSDVLSHSPPQCTTGYTLITGAAMGIGRAFAQALAKRGHRLLLLDVRDQELQSVARLLRDDGAQDVMTLSQDLAQKSGPRLIASFCAENRLPVTTLINNAGIGACTPFHEQPLWRIEEIIRVNIVALVTLTRLFIPEMLARRSGTIVNVSSTAAFDNCAEWAIYGATKAFVQSFTESLQEELSGSGIYVATICPGMTRTNFFESAGMSCPQDVQDPESVVAEALEGIDRRMPLIVTGRSNRVRIQVQRMNLRRLLSGLRGGLRRVGVLS